MADDLNANINVNIDTKDALRQLRQLQAALSRFNQALTQGNIASVNAQKGLTDQLIQSINATGKFVASQKEIATSTKSFTDALEKNKLSLKEYFRYTAAAATADTKVFSKAFAAEREVLNRARRDRVKLLQSQYIQLTNANGELVKVLQVVPKHLEMVNGKYADYATRVQMAAQRQQFLNQLLKQGSTQLLNFGKNTQWAGRQLMVGLTIPLTMMGTAASRAFMDMEEALIKFSKVYGDTFTSNSATEKAIQDIKRLSLEFTKYGIAAKDTIDMASSAAAMGLVGDALEAQVRQATRLSVLGQVEQQQALETTISLQNAFGISTEQLAQKINFLNAVENQTVLSIEDLTIAIPKAGPVVKQLGGSVEDLAFFLTAMKEGGINASEGANALKSGLAALINPTDKASEMLAGLGVNIKGIVESNAGDLKGTVVGFARALDTLDPLNRARAIEQLFGKFQFARLSTLFKNVATDGSQAARAFRLAGASVEELAILSERELGKVENAVGVKFKKTVEQLKLELVPIGKAFLEALTPVVKFIGDILKKFNGLSDGTKKVVTIITGVLGLIAPVALMSIGLVANGVANLIKFFAMLRGGIAKLNGANQVLGGGFDYLTQQEIENLAETNALHTSHQNLISTFNVEAGALNALAGAYANATSQARALAASAPGLFNTSPGVKAVTPPPVKGYKDGVFSVPGTGSGDKVPAMLEPGETVVSKDNTEKYGPLLQAIATDSVPGYRKGRYDVAASQSDRLFASGTVKPGATQDFIINELGRIRDLSDKELISYAKRTGKVLADTSKETLEGVREAIISELKDIVNEARQLEGGVTEGNISSIGKRFDVEKGMSRMGAYAPKIDQQWRDQFSHVGTAKVKTLEELRGMSLKPSVAKALDVMESQGLGGKDFRVADAFGYSMRGNINRGMASKGSAAAYEEQFGKGSLVKDFVSEFERTGSAKWEQMTKIMGADFDSLQGQIQIYDDALLEKIKLWQEQNANKPIPDLLTDDVIHGLSAEVEAQIQTIAPEFSALIKKAKETITAIRISVSEEELQMLNQAASEAGIKTKTPFGPETGNAKVLNREARTSGQILGTTTIDGLNDGAGTASPSKKSKKTGNDIGDGLIIGMHEKEVAVKAQSDRLANAALPTASETADKVSRMDLANKAFYDDLNNEENRDIRQVLKSQDRQRRKRGVGRRKVQPIAEDQKTGSVSASIRVSSKKTIKSAKVLAEKTEQTAQAQEQAANIANQTTITMTDVKDTTQRNAEVLETTNQDLLTQGQLNDAISQTDQDRSEILDKTQQVEQETLQAKQEELDAARINAQQAMDQASIPDGAQTLIDPATGEMIPYGASSPIMTSKERKMAKKKALAEKRGLRKEKVQRFSGKVSGGLGVAAMAAGALGAPTGVTAALGTGAMVAQFAPMLAGMGPVGWAVTAIAALGVGAKVLNDKLTKAAEATATYVKQTSITAGLLKKIGEQQGTVGASEIMSKRRGGSAFGLYNEAARKGTDASERFMSGEAGQQMQKTFTEVLQKQGMDVATKTFAMQLAGAVSDGTISGKLASDIAYQLGVNLKDSSITMQVDGYLRSLIGRDGEDLTKDPLAVRTRIANVADIRSQDALSKLQSGDQGSNSIWSQIGTLGLIGKASGSGLAAEFAASSSNAIEVAQAQADAMALYYEDQIKSLEAQKAATTDKQKQLEIETKIKAMQDQQIAGMQRMNSLVAARLESAVSGFNENINSGQTGLGWLSDVGRREDAYFDALKGNVKGKYKGTAFEGSAQQALNTLARSDEDPSFMKTDRTMDIAAAKSFEAKMQLVMESGQMNPDQVNTILEIFKGNLKEADALVNIGMRTVGGQKTAELFGFFKNFKDKKSSQLNIGALIRLSKSNPQQFDSVSNAMALLQQSDGLEIDMEAYIKTVGLTGLIALSEKLNNIEALKSPITKEVVTKFGQDNNVNMQGVIDNWDYYGAMPDVVQKEALQTYTALYDNLIHFENEDARRAWATKQAELEALGAGAKGSKEYEDVYKTRFEYYTAGTLNDPTQAAKIANQQTEAKYGSIETIKANIPPAGPKDAGKGNNPLDFLDSLAMRIKNVRDGAFDATKPLQSMIAAFTSKKAQKDASKMFTIFDGLQQRMLKMKVPKEFRDMIMGMSSEDFSKLANLKGDKAIFKFAEGKPKTKSNITGLTKTGQAIMQTYREAQAGEYQLAQKETVQNIKDQNTAFNQLVASGMSATEALAVVEDQAVASAVAAGAVGKTGSTEMKQFVKDIKEANSALERQKVINDMINKNEEFKLLQQMPQLASSLKATGMSVEQIDEVLNDPQLAKVLIEDLKDGKIDAKEIADYLNSIPARKVIEIQTKMNKGDFAGAAAEGRDIVDQMFDIQERLIRTGADPRSTAMVDKMKANTKEIKAAENAARALRKQIEDINEEISDMQREIEINYTRPIEDMNEKISDFNRTLEVGGEYEIGGKKMNLDFKLSNRYMEQLNQESNKLSNDLQVISHQSDAINEKYDKQAESLRKVAEINDQITKQQQNQLTLADAITEGDISAAAAAVQQSRADASGMFQDQAMAALEQSRTNELNALVGPESGLTQEQIQERQYQIQQELYRIETSPERTAIKAEMLRLEDEIYKLEELREAKLLEIRKKEDEIYDIQEKQLEPLERKIDDLTYENQLLQDQIDALVEQITVLGMNRDEWERVKAKIDASALAAQNFGAALAGLLAAVNAINSAWDATLAKIQSYSSMSSPAVSPIVKQAEEILDTAKKNDAEAKDKVDAATNLANAQAYVNKINADAKTASGRNYVTDAQMDRALAAADSKYGTNLYGGNATKAPIVDEQTKIAAMRAAANPTPKPTYTGYRINDRSSGGLIIRGYANGGRIKPIGTDTVPALLTPGEFIMSRYAVNSYGLDKMKAINNGDSIGESVYNYSINVNVKSDAKPDEIANAVMVQLKRIDSQRITGVRI